MPPVFTVGWVCALPVELAAAEEIMDEEYDPLPYPPTDTNLYTFGRVGAHNVVAACLPAGKTGNNSAAVVASQMRNSFPALRFGLLVGIGGGVPSQEHDIRLGDVVISQPAAQYGGVVQFDFGKTELGGDFTRTGSLDAPPTILLNALAKLRANILRGKLHIREHLSAFMGLENFACPGSEQDVLYSASSQHVPGSTCASCKLEDIVVRQARSTLDPVLFFGTIASGNRVMKDAPTRDHISQKLGGVLCFEMEAAGLMNNFGCLVVRGICDYADTHKNKQWQPYAAATAAACAKELLLLVPQVVSASETSQMAHPTLPVRSTVPSLSDEDRDCLRSLAFPEQESRGQEIHFAQNTCQWLLMDYQYWEWTKKARGLFWVKGSPGTGKSALMKCAATTMRDKQPGELVLSYFIHGRGTDLQKSVLGVFRALLNTILASFPQYLSKLTKTFKDREERYGSHQEKRWSWAVQELQDCMLETLSKGAKDKPVIIFVDALDECGEQDAKALLNYFRDLMQRIEIERAKVKICLSSRHYPILGSNTIPTVSVEERNGTDIQLVIHERLKQIAFEKRRRQIEEQILSKSQGGFQWAVLVADKIIDGDTTGIKETNLLKMLTSIPETLDGLYGNLLNRCNGFEKEQMVKLFQWILFARRPLSSQELREALATDKGTTSVNVDLLRRHDSWVENLSQFEIYVKNLSRGLVEFQDRDVWEQHEADAEPWNREAQFIHQSVADYLLEKFLHYQDGQTTARSVVGVGHFEISRSCCRYITMSDMQDGAGLSRGSLSVRFPLAPYAVQSLFHHIRKVEQEGLLQLDLLSLIQWDRRPNSLQQIAQLWNILDPDYGHAPEGWPFIEATALHVLIAFGSESALDAILQDENVEIDRKDSQGNTPLLLALRECYPKMALMLLDRSSERIHRHIRAVHENIDQQGSFGVDVNATNEEGDTPLSIALTTTEAGELILRLIKAGADVEGPRQKAELFVYAIRNMDSALFMDLITEYGAPDGAVFFVSQEMSSGDNDHILEVFLLELLNAGAKTSRSWEFDGFSNTNNTDGHYNDDSDDDADVDDADDNGDGDEEVITLASRKGQTSVVKLLLSHNISPDLSNISGETSLLLAVSYRHIEIVKLLLAAGASPDVADDVGVTAFRAALRNGDFETAGLLIDQGTSPDITEDIGQMRLNMAIRYKGPLKIVKLVVDKGAQPNIADSNGELPLNLALVREDLKLIRFLLAKGASPAAIDGTGNTPLSIALRHNMPLDIIELFIDKGASPATVDGTGNAPLNIAISHNMPLDIIELLIEKGASPAIVDGTGNTALNIAIRCKIPLDTIELLIEKGASPAIVDGTGNTALNIAIRCKIPLETVKLLVDKGAQPNIADSEGELPLNLALVIGQFEVVDLLLSKGAILKNYYGETQIAEASARGHLEIVKMLLEYGADQNTMSCAGQTALSSAAGAGHLEVVRLLLAKGANTELTDMFGDTPLILALRNMHFEIARLLLAKGACRNVASVDGLAAFDLALSRESLETGNLFAKGTDLDAAGDAERVLLYSAWLGSHSSLSDLLLKGNVNADTSSNSGWTALDLAAAGGHLEVTRSLLTNGADPNIASKNGWKPLNTASANGHLEVVRLLIEKNASIDAQDDGGRTPVYMALIGGHLEIVTLLLEAGADPNIASKRGQTPLQLASACRYTEIAELLLEKGAKRP